MTISWPILMNKASSQGDATTTFLFHQSTGQVSHFNSVSHLRTTEAKNTFRSPCICVTCTPTLGYPRPKMRFDHAKCPESPLQTSAIRSTKRTIFILFFVFLAAKFPYKILLPASCCDVGKKVIIQ